MSHKKDARLIWIKLSRKISFKNIPASTISIGVSSAFKTGSRQCYPTGFYYEGVGLVAVFKKFIVSLYLKKMVKSIYGRAKTSEN